MVYSNAEVSFSDYNGKRLINLFPWVIISDYDPINNTEIINLHDLKLFSYPDIIVWKGKREEIEEILDERKISYVVENIENIESINIYLLKDAVLKHFSNEERFRMFEIL